MSGELHLKLGGTECSSLATFAISKRAMIEISFNKLYFDFLSHHRCVRRPENFFCVRVSAAGLSTCPASL